MKNQADIHKTTVLFQLLDDYNFTNDFVESVRSQFQAKGFISIAQYDKLEEMFEEFKVDNDLL